MKAADSIGGPNDSVLIPPTPTKTDYAVDRGTRANTVRPLTRSGQCWSLPMRSPCARPYDHTAVDGEVRQTSSTADMIFSVEFIVRWVSRLVVLYAGDVIDLGTPGCDCLAFTPPRFLVPGDDVRVEIQGLGRQEHRFERASGSRAYARRLRVSKTIPAASSNSDPPSGAIRFVIGSPVSARTRDERAAAIWMGVQPITSPSAFWAAS